MYQNTGRSHPYLDNEQSKNKHLPECCGADVPILSELQTLHKFGGGECQLLNHGARLLQILLRTDNSDFMFSPPHKKTTAPTVNFDCSTHT